MMIHTFVVCAYKESAYLENCIKSLLRQTVQSEIIVSTATPNAFIQGICKKYDLPLRINNGVKGLAGDWNFAYSQADTPLITLAHQDDLYERKYTEHMISAYEKHKDALILFSDYSEYRNGKRVSNNTNLRIKKMLLVPLRVSAFTKSRFVRRRVLSLGNPICCPAVTFVKDALEAPVFEVGMSSNSDWQAWERLSKEKGAFVYIPKPLMAHRIHEASTTSEIIGDNKRQAEDLEVLCRFWPTPIAKMIGKVYAKSENSNEL